MVLVGGCASSDRPQQGAIGFVEGFLGGVAADEPRAATIGRDVLSAGGTAADAAVATYFALSVTLPSSAGLGGGGVCVVHDARAKRTETLDFLARAPRAIPVGADRPTAVPGNPRGFFALHSRFGRLRWEQLVGSAENLARFGTPVSRAFAHDLAQVGEALLTDPEVRRVFGQEDGRRVAREGDILVQYELASILGLIRRAGPGDFYDGRMAHELVSAIQAAGGSLDIEDLRGYRPMWRETIRVPYGNRVAHFASPPGAAGAVEAQMWRMLADRDRFEDALPAGRLHLLAETALRAFADRGRWLREDGASAVPPAELATPERAAALMASYRDDRHTPSAELTPAPVERLENPSATSFVAVDRDASAVACALTMNNLFGTGRLARGTGILPAALPGPGGRGPTSLGPMLVINEHVNEFIFAGAASGGATAPTSLMNVAARALLGGQDLAQAIEAKRTHHQALPDTTFIEGGLDQEMASELSRRGHRLVTSPSLGRVNAAYCPQGLPSHPYVCAMAADAPPRGHGLAATGD